MVSSQPSPELAIAKLVKRGWSISCGQWLPNDHLNHLGEPRPTYGQKPEGRCLGGCAKSEKWVVDLLTLLRGIGGSKHDTPKEIRGRKDWGREDDQAAKYAVQMQ